MMQMIMLVKGIDTSSDTFSRSDRPYQQWRVQEPGALLEDKDIVGAVQIPHDIAPQICVSFLP